MSKVEWTKEQLQAIQQTGSNLLVAAGAGSGKTAVLVERMIHKIIQQKIDIDQLLVVTFTNAAASEMKERILEAIYQKIEEEPQNMHLQKQIHLIGRANICTIDSFCLEVVKNNFYEIGQSYHFRIADSAELELLKQEVLDDLFDQKYEIEDKEFLNLLETYTTYSSDDPLKELILNIYQFIQSHPFPIEWLEEQIEKYHDLEEKQDIDFSQTEWGKLILDYIKENLMDATAKLEQIKSNLERLEELKKYVLVLNQDIETVQQIIQCKTWDQTYQLNLTKSFEKWPIDKKINLEEKEIAKEKRNEIKKQVNKILEMVDCHSKQAMQDIGYMYKPLCALKNLIIEYDDALKKAKQEKNIVDFNDIEHMALNILLQKNEAGQYEPSKTAKRYQNQYVEIAIDEYQDSNLVQEKILTSISNGHNMFMVGDVKQSIYKFRQARPELFLEKYETYHFINQQEQHIESGNKIQLFQNFRSRATILDTTNFIFQKIMSKKLGDIQYEKEEFLNLGANFGNTPKETIGTNTEILIVENKDQPIEQEEGVAEEKEVEEPIENIELEAKFVAHKIKAILDSKQVVFDKKVGYRPITYKDIVILLRSTKDKASIFENELIGLKIPVYSDTSLEYLSSIEIETMMNLLRVIDNPTMDIPLVCVLRSMIGGFTDNELIQIRLMDTTKCFYDAMKQYLETENDALKYKIETFFQTIQTWKQESAYMDLDELIWKIYMDTGYYNYVSLMPDGLLRQANLKLLFEKAKQYEEASFKGLYHFIQFIDHVKKSSKDLSSAKLIGENENVVRIMSIHKSKGLEFPLVFLCNSQKKINMQDLNSPILLHQDLGLGVNYINSSSSSTKVQYPTLAKEAIKIKSKEEMISEEMRVLYVALTRAKEKLIITGVSKDLEKSLHEKQALLNLYAKEEKVNVHLLKKYSSYLDWIELGYLKEKTDHIQIEKMTKEDIEASIQDAAKLEMSAHNRTIEDVKKKAKEAQHITQIQAQLNWKYPYIELSKIEAKSSVSKIKQASLVEPTMMLKSPVFFKEAANRLTGAQKGTLLHLCMQNLKVGEDYTTETLQEFVQNLLLQKKITKIEAENIDILALFHFTQSHIWQELKTAKHIEREKPFYLTVSADEIYQNGMQEEILVQGIIDLFYINSQDELVLVDYKTDHVTAKEELAQKYEKQLAFYQRALEEAMNQKVVRTYLYSTYLSEAILL